MVIEILFASFSEMLWRVSLDHVQCLRMRNISQQLTIFYKSAATQYFILSNISSPLNLNLNIIFFNLNLNWFVWVFRYLFW